MTTIATSFNLRARSRARALVVRALVVCTLAVGPALCAAAVVIDDTGRRVAVPAPPLRIASLAPNVTAMLFAAGAGPQVVATTAYSIEPPAAQRIPRIGDANAIDLERLAALHPSVVVAWSGGENAAEIDRIERLGIPIYREQVEQLAQLSASVRRLGALAGTRAAADAEAGRLDERLAALRARYAGAKPVTVLLQVWDRPIYTVGGTHLLTDALRVCGARNVFADLGGPSPVVSAESVIARDPDIIVAAAPSAEGDRWLAAWRRFPRLRAVAAGNLLPFDDQRLSRMGPGVLEATQGLCELIDAARRRVH